MQIRSAALIGAGAIGAYFIAGLSDYLGENFSVIAEGERKKKLETKGLTINDRNYRLNVKLPEDVVAGHSEGGQTARHTFAPYADILTGIAHDGRVAGRS